MLGRQKELNKNINLTERIKYYGSKQHRKKLTGMPGGNHSDFNRR